MQLHGSSTPVRRRPRGRVPRLSDGVELLGEYRDSGFQEAPYIARLPGGVVVQLTRLLYLVARAVDGRRDLDEIAAQVSAEFGRRVTAANVAYLLDQKLAPLGVLAGDGEAPPLPSPAAPLALTMRAAVVPAEIVRPLAALLRFLFRPTFVGAAMALLVVLDVWLFGHHGLGAAVREILFHPILVMLVLALVICSAVFHELGHAAACRYGGARPAAMGAGFYLVWPAFYTDVTDAYRLDRRGRLRTDLGGIYFNVLFALGTAAIYFETGFEPLLAFVALQHLQILNQFVPWVRLDGYYVLTDVTGVPDILTRVKPVLLSLIPDRPAEPRVAELKPWVRAVLSVYVLTLFPALALVMILMLVHAPRFFATAATALHVQAVHAQGALGRHDLPGFTLAAVQMLALLRPTVGISLTIGRVGAALVRRLRRWLGRVRKVRLALVFAAVAGLAALGFVAAPSSERTGRATDAHGRPPRPASRARARATSGGASVPSSFRTMRTAPPRRARGNKGHRPAGPPIAPSTSSGTSSGTPTGTQDSPTTNTQTTIETTTTSTPTSTAMTTTTSPTTTSTTTSEPWGDK